MSYYTKSYFLKHSILLIIAALFPALLSAQVYVDAANPGPTHDGLSWATAWTTIQAAIDDPRSAEQPIFVAMGIYQENLTLTSQRQLYGGFQTGDANFNDRDPLMNKTTIEATGPAPRRAITAINAVLTVVEGFTIRFGNANGAGLDGQGGGALYVGGGEQNIIRHCYIDDNHAGGDGGGMAVMAGASPLIEFCTFIRNRAEDDGGGLYITNGSSPEVRQCEFLFNEAGDRGGGFYVSNMCEPEIIACVVQENQAREGGGGFFRDRASASVFIVEFKDNRAAERGGGAGVTENSMVFFETCFFIGNAALTPQAGAGVKSAGNLLDPPRLTGFEVLPVEFGAGVYVDGSNPVFQSCVFDTGVAKLGGGAGVWNASPVFEDCLFQSNFETPVGGGAFVAGQPSVAEFRDCEFFQNDGVDGGAVFVTNDATAHIRRCRFKSHSFQAQTSQTGSVVLFNFQANGLVEDCTFVDNAVRCVTVRLNSSAHINRCLFAFNRSESDGAVIAAESNQATRPLMTNCIMTNNRSSRNGVVSAVDSTLDVVNCTLDENSSQLSPSAVHARGMSDLRLINTIVSNSHDFGVWRESANSVVAMDSCLFRGNAVAHYRDQPANTSYFSAVEINGGVAGAINNVDVEPRFAMDEPGGHAGILDQVVLDNQTFTTLLTDTEAAFPYGGLVGRIIKLENLFVAFEILANTETVIAIRGDLTFGVSAGSTYRVLDYAPTRQSGTVDRGRSDGTPDHDFALQPRPVDTIGAGTPGRSVDIGAYELQLSHYIPGESWILR